MRRRADRSRPTWRTMSCLLSLPTSWGKPHGRADRNVCDCVFRHQDKHAECIRGGAIRRPHRVRHLRNAFPGGYAYARLPPIHQPDGAGSAGGRTRAIVRRSVSISASTNQGGSCILVNPAPRFVASSDRPAGPTPTGSFVVLVVTRRQTSGLRCLSTTGHSRQLKTPSAWPAHLPTQPLSALSFLDRSAQFIHTDGRARVRPAPPAPAQVRYDIEWLAGSPPSTTSRRSAGFPTHDETASRRYLLRLSFPS